eukprot:344460_1
MYISQTKCNTKYDISHYRSTYYICHCYANNISLTQNLGVRWFIIIIITCCWVNSAWTDLSMESDTVKYNSYIDAIMLVNDDKKYFERMAVGKINKYAKTLLKNIMNVIDEGKKD